MHSSNQQYEAASSKNLAEKAETIENTRKTADILIGAACHLKTLKPSGFKVFLLPIRILPVLCRDRSYSPRQIHQAATQKGRCLIFMVFQIIYRYSAGERLAPLAACLSAASQDYGIMVGAVIAGGIFEGILGLTAKY